MRDQNRFQTKSLAWAKISAGEDGEDDPDNGESEKFIVLH